MALQTMIDGGMKKKDRKNKQNIDLISAVLILQTYMQTINK
jgi:putative Holliday junction resolvase